MNHYETVFILNPVLSEDQVKEAVQKYADIITSNSGEIVDKEDWGLKKFAYTIQNKKSGFYVLFSSKNIDVELKLSQKEEGPNICGAFKKDKNLVIYFKRIIFLV